MSKQSARKRREEGKLTSVQNATAGGAETSRFLGRTGREAKGRKEVTRRCCSRGTEVVGCNGKETPRRGGLLLLWVGQGSKARRVRRGSVVLGIGMGGDRVGDQRRYL